MARVMSISEGYIKVGGPGSYSGRVTPAMAFLIRESSTRSPGLGCAGAAARVEAGAGALGLCGCEVAYVVLQDAAVRGQCRSPWARSIPISLASSTGDGSGRDSSGLAFRGGCGYLRCHWEGLALRFPTGGFLGCLNN